MSTNQEARESAVREENERCAQILENGAQKFAENSPSRNLLEAHALVIRATCRYADRGDDARARVRRALDSEPPC